MSNPLTPEQIADLRSLPNGDHEIDEAAAKLLGFASLAPVSQQTCDRGYWWTRTAAANVLLATIDSETQRAVTAERERVAGVVDDVASTHHMLPTFAFIRELRRALFAATKQPGGRENE